MNKFKLTPQAYKDLLRLSKELPVMWRRDKNGELMRRVVTKFNGTDASPHSDLRNYKNFYQKGSEPILVNHMVNLVEIYQKDGQRGIDVYAEHFKKMIK